MHQREPADRRVRGGIGDGNPQPYTVERSSDAYVGGIRGRGDDDGKDDRFQS